MKISDLFEAKVYKTFKTAHATINYDWKKDLLDEEDEDYLPKGYDPKKVLEIQLISVNSKEELNKGYGSEIMKKFLALPIAQKAELIFLDVNPYSGFSHVSSTDYKAQNKIMDQLETFYKKFGFKNKRKHGRMWLVQKGIIPDKDLPT